MKKVNLAIIGCGQIAQNAHIPNALSIPEAKLVAVVDINKKKLGEVREKFGIENCYTDYHEVLKDPQIHAVIICTPTYTHTNIANDAAEARKHIFCEKPMSITSEEAEKVIKVANTNAVKLMVGHYLRFLPNHIKAKEMIKGGKIGKIFYVEAHSELPGPYNLPRSHFFFKKKEGGGVLFDYGIHLIDMLCWLIDDSKVNYVAALTHTFMDNLEVESAATIILRFVNKILGRISMFWVPWKSWETIERYVKILGSKGKVMSELTGPSLLLYKEGSLISRLKGMQRIIPKPLHPKLPGSQYAYRKEIEHFINCIIKDKTPKVTGYDAVTAIKIIEAALQSDETQRFVKVE